jgi:histidinol-phosphate/aromatic aminotransferase/cobyric acid decarboxylase-like protein
MEGLGERFFRVALLKRKDNEKFLAALASVLLSVNHLDKVCIPWYKN